jgi:phosphonate transport system substrate-binding protein
VIRPLRSCVFKAAAAVVLAAASFIPFIASAQQVFRVTAIPDEAPTELVRKFEPLGKYLGEKLGMKIEFVATTDYAATVEALIGKKVDMAWFGGFTFVQANVRSKGMITPLVQREEDQHFRSVFITGINSGITSLDGIKGHTFTFGAPSSTSGSLMPRYYLLKANIDPERDFKRVAFSGAHDATALAVLGGKVDAGALNISVWEKLIADNKIDPKLLRVIYTTPPYYDYNWSVRSDMDPAIKKKLLDAFLALRPDTPEGKAVLDLQRATRFVATSPENYTSIEEAAKSADLLK